MTVIAFAALVVVPHHGHAVHDEGAPVFEGVDASRHRDWDVPEDDLGEGGIAEDGAGLLDRHRDHAVIAGNTACVVSDNNTRR